MSIGRMSVPEASIFSFSHRWGSGLKGAKPSSMAATTRMFSGSLSIQFNKLFSSFYDSVAVVDVCQVGWPVEVRAQRDDGLELALGDMPAANSSARRAAAGVSRSPSTTCPLGRPMCDMMMSVAPCSSR